MFRVRCSCCFTVDTTRARCDRTRKVIAQDGAAHLSFLVPKRAKSKQLQVRLTVRTGAGESATKTASFRVR